MNRRGLLKGAAWGVPVIAAVVAVPQAAASCPKPVPPSSYDPRDYTDHRGPQNNAAKITVTPGRAVVVEFIRDYPNAGALNVDHKLYGKRSSWRAGDVVSAPLAACTDPKFIQIDGNNVHYHGGGTYR